jgi:DNA modification methylase
MSEPSWDILVGDCRDILGTLPDRSVHTVVTSPPYFGLRDYGTGEWVGGDPGCEHEAPKARQGATGERAGRTHTGLGGGRTVAPTCTRCGAERLDRQIGLEPTPDEFVAALVTVFREVRRVLRDDGTVWLNLGDSYAHRASGRDPRGRDQLDRPLDYRQPIAGPRHQSRPAGYKSKDLIGIPWMVAQALQAPYYTGATKDERDRIWLAAMIDAEGCMYLHRRKAGQANGQGNVRRNDSFGAGLEVANTSRAIVERCAAITGRGSIVRQEKDRRQPLYRWTLRTNECRNVLREVYPYLVAKQQEARLVIGCPSSGPGATAAWEAVKGLHGGVATDVDFDPPASLYEPGWYLRSDVIWAKPNPMPESVADRPTRAHEYLFLLTKSPSYFYDADEVSPTSGGSGTIYNTDRMGDHINYVGRNRRDVWIAEEDEMMQFLAWKAAQRDERGDVWLVSTKPYVEAHFATFPPDLIEPCVLAGSPERACAACGAPWVRLVDRQRTFDGEPVEGAGAWAGPDDPRRMSDGAGHYRWATVSTTLGFEPSCACEADITPGVVLDPFAGAATTGLAAIRAKREFVGIELSETFAQLGRERIETDIRLGHRPPRRAPAPADGQATLDLFAETATTD